MERRDPNFTEIVSMRWNSRQIRNNWKQTLKCGGNFSPVRWDILFKPAVTKLQTMQIEDLSHSNHWGIRTKLLLCAPKRLTKNLKDSLLTKPCWFHHNFWANTVSEASHQIRLKQPPNPHPKQVAPGSLSLFWLIDEDGLVEYTVVFKISKFVLLKRLYYSPRPPPPHLPCYKGQLFPCLLFLFKRLHG